MRTTISVGWGKLVGMNNTACRWIVPGLVGVAAFNIIAWGGLIAGRHFFDNPEAGLVVASALFLVAVAAPGFRFRKSKDGQSSDGPGLN